MKDKITGVMIYYYFVCKRKLWYFCHEINMEAENENVLLGKLLDENSYREKEKHINIDNVINIDFISEKRELHEVKKSRAIEEAGLWQMKYYLYYMRERGVKELNGEIDYPLLKQKVSVELSEEDCKKMKEILSEITEIQNASQIPPLEKRGICKKCAYPDAPCRHPEKMFPCIESYGILVTDLAEKYGISFMNGANVVTWFSLLLYR